MRRILFVIIMVLIFLFLSGCNSTNDTITVKDGVYMAKDSKSGMLPCVSIKEGNIYFYDAINSQLTLGASGTYVIEDDILTMTTEDNMNTYVFKIDGDNLIFQKDKSSSANIINEINGDKIKDNEIFYLISE